jgi:hypothetical protein
MLRLFNKADAPPATNNNNQLFQLSTTTNQSTNVIDTATSAFDPVGSWSSLLPFDAATVPGSSVLQFVARDASKPSRPTTRSLPSSSSPPSSDASGSGSGEGELWTAVSTVAFAQVSGDVS